MRRCVWVASGIGFGFVLSLWVASCVRVQITFAQDANGRSGIDIMDGTIYFEREMYPFSADVRWGLIDTSDYLSPLEGSLGLTKRWYLPVRLIRAPYGQTRGWVVAVAIELWFLTVIVMGIAVWAAIKRRKRSAGFPIVVVGDGGLKEPP